MSERTLPLSKARRSLAWHGWVGLGLMMTFWLLNWSLPGLRTHWAFFPLWLGYCLTVDALTLLRRGTSLLTRNWRKYVGLFLISAPVWWIFEALNWRLNNWHYQGAEDFTPFAFWFWATLNFTTVIPAVFGGAEFFASFKFVQRLGHGPKVSYQGRRPLLFFCLGLGMFIAMWLWPRLLFPLAWISIYFITEPLNIWLGNRHLARWMQEGDWRPVLSLWLGVLMAAFFWEMWNYLSFPKWVYHVPWGQFWHIFEMPALGYLGYLPFALELHALYHFITGLVGKSHSDYLQIEGPPPTKVSSNV